MVGRRHIHQGIPHPGESGRLLFTVIPSLWGVWEALIHRYSLSFGILGGYIHHYTPSRVPREAIYTVIHRLGYPGRLYTTLCTPSRYQGGYIPPYVHRLRYPGGYTRHIHTLRYTLGGEAVTRRVLSLFLLRKRHNEARAIPVPP